MRSAEYWAKRMEELQESLLSKGDAYAADMRKEYDKALARITADVERWYGRLAANNEVSLADAKKLLSKGELKEFRWSVEEYIERGQENAIDQRWAKELENASAKTHISRLEQIQMQIRNEVEQLAGRQQKGVTDVLGETYKDGYYRSVYELEKGKGFGTGFAKLDVGQIDKTLAKPWAPDGSNFSSRIWADRTKLVNELQTTLTQSLINGSTSDKVISDFAKRMGVAKSNAERLILTEAAHFAGQSRLDAYKETGVKEYEFLATLDKRTSEICRSMDGERIKLSDAQTGVNYPPLHVRCRSTTVPVVEDAEPTGERAARQEDGSYYTVPEDTTYAVWTAKRAPEAVKPAAPETPKAVDPPAVTTIDPEHLEPGPETWYDEVKMSKADIENWHDQIVDKEPTITEQVKKAVLDNGGEMQGLDFRIKTKESLLRKVEADYLADKPDMPDLRPMDVVKSVNDALRYTAVAPPEAYFDLYSAVMLQLLNEGHTVKKIKNTWLDAANPYSGVNVILVSPTGQPYELQFHTLASFDLKQNVMHGLYEEYRLPTTSRDRKKELWEQMLRLADGLVKPDNIDRIK